MKRKAWIFVFFAATVILTQCAPKISKQTTASKPKEEMPANSGGNGTDGSTTIQPNVPAQSAVNDPVPVDASSITEDEKTAYREKMIGNGKLLWTMKCGKCHELYLASTRSSQEWTGIMEVMAKKANLEDIEKLHITTYLQDGAKKW